MAYGIIERAARTVETGAGGTTEIMVRPEEDPTVGAWSVLGEERRVYKSLMQPVDATALRRIPVTMGVRYACVFNGREVRELIFADQKFASHARGLSDVGWSTVLYSFSFAPKEWVIDGVLYPVSTPAIDLSVAATTRVAAEWGRAGLF